MAKFRSQPKVIEAEQFRGGLFRDPRGACHCGSHAAHVHTIHKGQPPVVLVPGDWVVQEPDGVHYYPVKDDIFQKSYRPAENAPGEVMTEAALEVIMIKAAQLECSVAADSFEKLAKRLESHPDASGLYRAAALLRKRFVAIEEEGS